MKKRSSFLFYASRFLLLSVLFILFFMLGAIAVDSIMPELESEPGLLSAELTLLMMAVMNTLLIMALIESSHYRGWKLALGLAFAYYGAVTFIMQIETWYFLTDISVPPALLPRLFLMGLPVAFLYIPLAVVLMGKLKFDNENKVHLEEVEAINYWVLKPALIALAYILLYWSAGYFIAWQNPELRAFYGSPGEALPFWVHTLNTLKHEPFLFPFQALRGLLWALFALPVIYGSRWGRVGTALLVGFLFSIPQNIVHLMENPLMPLASVRLSHMIETASSTFIFGIIVALLLYRKHNNFGTQ
jgi:hypothetical protein